MNRTDRLHAITEALRAAGPGGRTSAWLATRFEVHARAIKRDVGALQQAGHPIWAEGGPGGGYVLDPTATLPPVTFTEAEAVALAKMLTADADAPFQADGRRALTKVRAAMTAGGRDRGDALAARVWIRSPDEGTRPPQLRVVEEAVRANRVVVIDYVDREGTSSMRRPVEPVAFARNRGRWYLLAWCRRARAGRWFRLDRIVSADLTAEAAPQRDVRNLFGQPPDDAVPVEF